MLNKLPQIESHLRINNNEPKALVRYINEYIQQNSCENFSVDISFMNILDACYVTTLCSTEHFIKYPNGRIRWKVSSNSIKEFNKDLTLGNVDYIIG